MPYDDAPNPEEDELSRRFRAWGATEEALPTLVARTMTIASTDARSPEDTAREVWLHHLYEQYVDALVRFVRARLGVQADAEDVVQDVFVKAASDLERYDPGRGSPRAWLYAIAYGLASNCARARRRREVREEVRDGGFEPAWSPSTEALTDVGRALAALPTECLEVFWFRRVEELTQSEVAAVLHVPFGTVASRLKRAESLLREAIERDRVRGVLILPALLTAGANPVDEAIEECVQKLRRAPLTQERRDAMWQRIRQKVVPPPAVAITTPSPRSLRAPSVFTHVVALCVGALAALAFPVRTAVTVVPARPLEVVATPMSPSVPDAPTSASPLPPLPTAPLPPPPRQSPPALTAPGARVPTTTTHPRADADETLQRELRRARAALARRSAGDATEALDAAEAAMQPGDSHEYLDSLRVEAAMLSGDRARAGALLTRFREQYPGSAHLARLDAWAAR